MVTIPLRTITSAGSYFVQFTRAFSAGGTEVANSKTFSVSLVNWSSAAGNYQALLETDAASSALVNDGAVYRGSITTTLTTTGMVSGRLSFNEPVPLKGAPLGERTYIPVVRNFSGRLVPDATTPSTVRLTSSIGPSTQTNREVLTLEFDLNTTPPSLSAKVVYTGASTPNDTCTSTASGVTKSATSLSSGSLLPGRYLLSANLASPAFGSEREAYVQVQITSTGVVNWYSRMKGSAGSGSALLRTNPTDQSTSTACIYESKQLSTSSLLSSASLLGILNFKQTTPGAVWGASAGSSSLPFALEKQASYLAKGVILSVLQPVYKPDNIASGSNWTGRTRLPFSEGNGGRWSGSTFQAFPNYFPTAKPLTLSASTPQADGTQISQRWRINISGLGVITSTPIIGTDAAYPPLLSLRLDRTTGVFYGIYSYGRVPRMLYGVAHDSTGSSVKRAAQGWVELGAAPFVQTGTWTLSE
jgi:hypothetical protein